jgi:hypothetical protein
MVENFIFGLWILVDLQTRELFKSYFNMEPGDMAVYMSIIYVPWSIKILYGLLSDNLKLCGYFRKPYLIIAAIIQLSSTTTLFFCDFQEPLPIVLLLFAT